MFNLCLHLIILLTIIQLSLVKYRKNQLNFVISTVLAFTAGVVFGVIGWTTTAAIGVAALIGYVGAALIYGGIALSLTMSKKSGDYAATSSTYSAQKQTQTNPDLPIPLLYGEVKVAGNRIWQDDETNNGIKRIVAFSDGEVSDFTDIRLNDILYTDIKGCKVEKYYGTEGQGLPSAVNVDTVGSLKYLAYLYINVPKGDKIDINYNLTTVVKGRKIRVYTTPTKYTVEYSNNPAWVMFDFLTCYNGRGLCLKDDGTVDDEKVAQLFDLNTFIESAAFCDETVVTNGKETKRFTFNMIFDSQTSHKTLLDEIQRSCRGGLFTKDGKLQFKIDKAEPVSKIFNESDILDGSETFQTIPNEENYEVLKIDYISPEHEWQKVQAYAELPMTRTGIPIEHTINAYSITNFQQASRLAWYYLNAKRLCPYFGSFKTGFKAYDLEVGQVIQIPVILMGLENYKVKVTSVVNNGTGTYTVNYRTYDERLYDDTLGCKEPTVIVSNLSDVFTLPEDVKNFNVVQSQSYFNFVWEKTSGISDTYEIRYGNSWDNGTIIGRQITENNFTWAIPTDGLYKFWIKAFNSYNYSENATLDVINVDSVPEVNEIVRLNILEDMQGEFLNTYIYHDTLKLTVNNVLWKNTENPWGADDYYQNYGYWGADVVNEGNYTSQVYDIGAVLESIVAFEHQYLTYDETQDVIIEWRYSEDNETWTDWKLCNIGSYTFRYCQFRATLRAGNNVQIILNTFKVAVDVPDKEEELELEVPESGSLAIEYNFIKQPSIIATVNDNVNAYVVIKDKTETGATVWCYLNDGTATNAKISLRLKGY